jgi:hemolysin III
MRGVHSELAGSRTLAAWPGYACFPEPGVSLMPMERLVQSSMSHVQPVPAMAHPEVRMKPRLRGVFHQYAFFVSLGSGVLLVLLAATTRASVAAAVYAASVSALFGVSALYHRVTWSGPARRRMRRLDHAMIFLLIAGTYTPVGLLVLHGTLATVVLAVVWGGAVAGIVLELAWTRAPRWLGGTVYLALGWVAVVAMPQLFTRLGVAGGLLLVAGGLVYSVGAAVYALRRPDPVPAVFGYHEVFHLLVIAGVATHFLAISLFALSPG